MLVLSAKAAEELTRANCLVIDCPDGTRVRVWLRSSPRHASRSKPRLSYVIDAPGAAVITRGVLVGPDADAPPERGA